MLLDQTSLDQLQGVYSSALVDICVIQIRSEGSVDDYGVSTPVFTDTDAVSCRFVDLAASEVLRTAEVPKTDAKFHVESDLEISIQDRLKLTKVDSLSISPIVFEIKGVLRTRWGWTLFADRVGNG